MKKSLFLITFAIFSICSSRADEKSLNVEIMGLTSPVPVTFTGSYVYVKAGKEIKGDISGTGNRSEAFWGDYIKSCTVQRASDQGWFKLIINENGQEIFKSAKISTNTPVVYEKK